MPTIPVSVGPKSKEKDVRAPGVWREPRPCSFLQLEEVPARSESSAGGRSRSLDRSCAGPIMISSWSLRSAHYPGCQSFRISCGCLHTTSFGEHHQIRTGQDSLRAKQARTVPVSSPSRSTSHLSLSVPCSLELFERLDYQP
jgi:hypothetical protein